MRPARGDVPIHCPRFPAWNFQTAILGGLDAGGCFRDSLQVMTAHSWLRRLGWLRILPAFLLLPTMVVGSICVPATGAPTLELGICVCMQSLIGSATPGLGGEESSECGPCRDESVSVVRNSRSTLPLCPPLAAHLVTLMESAELPHAKTTLGVRSSEEPPGKRPSVLRC
jgi:hypothetical protein